MNAAGLEAVGFSTEDILNGVNLLDVIAPDDQPRARENISKRLRREDEGLTEYIAIRKDGSIFPMLIRTTRILEGGEAIGLRGLAVDASKQKQIERDLLDNEARLNQSQKIARLGNWKLNIKTGKIWWCREYYSLLGLDSDTYSPNGLRVLFVDDE
ncbi:MAG: PAS domain S-box protein, partial [Candidatus Hydrogenedentota bacterium]